MKKLFALSLFTFTFSLFIHSSTQTIYVDSLKKQFVIAKYDTERFNMAQLLAYYYSDRKQDSFLVYAKQELFWANQLKDVGAVATAFMDIGNYNYVAGNYPGALQMLFKSLQLAESVNDSSTIIPVYERLGNAYKEYDEPENAKKYYLLCKVFAEKQHQSDFFSYCNLGYVCALMDQFDSALFYEQQAYALAVKTKSTQIGWTFLYLADIQLRLHNKALAGTYYKLAIDSLIKQRGISRVLSKGYLGMADFYRTYKLNDSAIYYAHLSMYVAKKLPYLKGVSIAARFLSETYDSLHQDDSELFYEKIFISTNDTLNNRNRTSSVENLTFLEQIREQEREQALVKTKEERNQNIQYALIALGIITFILLFFLLSRSIVANEKMIDYLGVIALLIVFEFLNLLLHPFLEKVTHGTPLFMLLALVCIAALLVPLHARLEKWVTHRLVEKNKQIRLAAAKKTIEKLENNKPQD
jgi:tetratricopeptide (TPR) repeat protein